MKAPDPLVRLAATVRGMFAGEHPIPHHRILECEYEHLHGALPDNYPANDPDPRHRLDAFNAAVHVRGHAALCLSGGGIRSASFAVGVLQGLARRKLMGAFDYVSTVSGGGYTGGWLSAWLLHAHANAQEPDQVFSILAGTAGSTLEPEAEPIRRIREYSNYLDPKTGLLSVDVWSLISTVARNLLLNWLVLVPLLAAAMLVPRLYYSMTMLGTQDWIDRDDLFWWSTWLVLVGSGLLTVSLVYIALDLPSVGNRQRGQSAFVQLCFLPLVVATSAFTLYWAWSRALNAETVRRSTFLMVGSVAHVAIWFLVGLMSPRRVRPMTWVAAAVTGALTGAGVWWFSVHVFAEPLAHGELFAGFSVPLILAIIGGTGSLFVGVASSETTEDDREWWSRFGAWLLITIFGWIATSLVVFVGPVVLTRAVGWVGDKMASPALGKLAAGALTALTGAVAARTGREVKNGLSTAALWRRIAFALAAPAFVLLLLVCVASANVWLLQVIESLHIVPEYRHPEGAGLPEMILLFVTLLVGGAVMGLVVAVNKFSLHGMYRNRLIRAFLGASRTAASRNPNRFTGFDSKDNVYLKELAAIRRPIHIVNMALNLVADNRLAWQERKAESFTVSPLAAGTRTLGYRSIAEYGGPDGMSLGTAITISGAAASPNMGYHSSPFVTFLLTLFNARLGAWLGNPSEAGRFTWRKSDPVIGAGPLLREMFGRTTAANPYVYLSDGGHFENLGLYEMVSRRCRFIVVSDAGCDADYVFEDLGNAIRKIRIDLGIRIEFPHGLGIDAQHARAGNAHGAVGIIRYADIDGAVENGTLLYLKATLSGDEPVDVANYAAAHTDFPHETTANQWFGESQFESYRVLGIHTVDSITGDYDGSAGLAGLVALIAAKASASEPVMQTL
ncbi:MAG TPA: patatin-like phospholipase family protein [Vicinamibacterales bacterium]